MWSIKIGIDQINRRTDLLGDIEKIIAWQVRGVRDTAVVWPL